MFVWSSGSVNSTIKPFLIQDLSFAPGAGLSLAWFTCECALVEAMVTKQRSSIFSVHVHQTEGNGDICTCRKRGRSLLGGSVPTCVAGSISDDASTTAVVVHNGYNNNKSDGHPRRSQRPTRYPDSCRARCCSIVLLLLFRVMSSSMWLGLVLLPTAATASATTTATKPTTVVVSRGQGRRRRRQQPATTGKITDAASQRHRRTPKRK